MALGPYQTAIIVGASSGIGKELALELAKTGCKVAVVARNLEALQELAARPGLDILPFQHDVKAVGDVPGLFQEITRQLGGLDLIIYSSGVLHRSAKDGFPTAYDLEMIEVNVSGAVAWLNEAATRFEACGFGTIVGIGSVAGVRGRAGNPVYGASKAFLHTYLEALRNRLSKKGVRVVTVKPGPVDTPMTAQSAFKKKLPADVAARRILKLSRRTGEFYLEPAHAVIFTILRHIPSALFRRLNLP